jgi:hypothetical protein
VGKKMEVEELDEDPNDRARGSRAEEVAEWYLRLNGLFLIHGFVVHPDRASSKPRTEADFLGIRLKESSEGIWRKSKGIQFRSGVNRASMTDDSLITKASYVGTVRRHLVAMVEVKSGKCSINGPWSDVNARVNDSDPSNMERALSRVGFGNHSEITSASSTMYENLRYEGPQFIVQYFAIGKIKCKDLEFKYPKLIQITFDEIAIFLRDRFSSFPEKIPLDSSITLWRGFGDSFRWWFESNGYGKIPSLRECEIALQNYIDKASCFSRS